jgi:predicted metal-dependent hydrolase
MIQNSQPDGGYVLCYGGKRIPFRIEYRKRKRLAITVEPDMRLEVIAPDDSQSEQVLERVEKRAGWIMRQWRYFEQFQPKHPGPRYVSGETLLYLGRQYRLKLHEGSPEVVKLVGRFLHIWTKPGNGRDRIKSLIDRWYRQHSERVLNHRLHVCLQQCPSLRRSLEPCIKLRRMTHRWGSCTKAGNVLLNDGLVKMPVHCIDYVIVHELCHLQIHNHSPAFYRLLNRCLPDWERRKQRLEAFEL